MEPLSHPETDPQRVVAQMSAAKSKDELLGALAEGLTAVLAASGAMAMLTDLSGTKLDGYLGRPAEKWPDIKKVRIDLSENAAVCSALKTGEPIAVVDAATDAATVKWLVQLYKCRSVLFLPIIAEKPIGCMVVSESRRLRHFTNDEVKVALDLTSIAGHTLVNL